MAKRLFSFVMMMTLAVCAWAQDVTTVSSQTLWTFDEYTSQTGVHHYQDIYLHDGTTSSLFNTDSEHVANTSGNFSNHVAWSATKVLTSSKGCNLPALSSNISAASTDGPEGSLAFSHDCAGKLYVVYGATSMTDGKFYIKPIGGELQASDMEGIDYTGILGTRTEESYKFTQAEACIDLTGSGTVYLGGSQPYCIYAILFVPTIDYPAVYGTYDFQTWAKENISGNDLTIIGLTSTGVMTGTFTPSTEGVSVNGTMTLNDVFSITGTDAGSYKLRKNGDASSGLMLVNTSRAKLTINRLSKGDWFTINTDVAGRLAFAADNTSIKKSGSETTITKDDFVESGVTYVVTEDTSVDIYSKGNVYIHSVTISNTEVVSPPTISANGNQVTITGGVSTDGKTVTTYYTLDGSTPTNKSTKNTGEITVDETRIVKAISISKSGVASSVTTQKIKIDGLTPSMVLDFANDEGLKPLAWGDDHFAMYYYTTADNSNSHFRYLTNSPIHAKIAWQSGGSNEENASTTDGEGLKKMVDGRAFGITDLAVGDVIYITYTTTGSQLKTSKHSSKGNTIKIGETTVTEGQTEIESTAKIEVTAVDEENNYVMFMPNSRMTISQIAINPVYTITTSVEHGTISVISPAGTDLSTATFMPGTEVTLKATAESSDWVFSHWVVNGAQESSATLTLTMDANKTVEAVFKQRVSATGVPVIIVAGQSNTDGRIRIAETAFPYTLDHTMISYCNGDVNGSYPAVTEGSFSTYGCTPKSDAGECWGYDAIIYDNIQKALGGNTDFYVIKQSKGNTAVNAMSTSGNNQHWWSANPVWLDRNTSANQGGRSLLLALKDNIDKSLKVFEDAGKEYDIKFLMWHQGEADRGKQNEYETQMKAVINYIRNYLVERTGNNKYSSLPVILGGIAVASSEYSLGVETGKQNIAAADANVYYAPTGTMTLDTDFRSDKVHFNATGANKLATTVWDIISTNKLLDGITLAGTDTPAEDLLKEDVVNKTTTWNFTEAGALEKNQSINGLYNHGGTVNKKDYGTNITLADGSEIDGTYAATTNAADRKASCTQGLTAGYAELTHVYSINANTKGTFIAVIRPLSIKDANTKQYARLMLNGEELQAVAITSVDENIQLIGKTTGKGTFAVTCGESWDFIGAKFIKGSSTIEVLTAPTIEAGSKINTIKITPGTSDQSDATVKTYYTTDGSTPSESSTEYDGTEIVLTADCVVRAVSISSNGSTTYSDWYTFTYEKPTEPVLYDFRAAYETNPNADLGISADNTIVVYYHRSSDDTDRNGTFNYVTAEPYNEVMSVLNAGMSMTAGGLKVNSARPFAIHGLKLGDVIRMEFSGSLYYAKNSTRGNALADMTVGDELENLGEYTVSSVDAANNYVVFFPSATTTIAQLSINKEVTPYTITDYYISPDGSDANSGIKTSPFKTLKKAQEMVQSKGKVHILPGTYTVTNAEYMDKTNGAWNVVYNLNKANVEYIGEVGTDGKRPVFDFSSVTAEDNKRITGFLLASKNIIIKNIETIGIQMPKISGDDTQSEFFRLNGATACTLQNIAAHNGNGIGFYIHGKSKDNLVVDCDAYENVDVINNTGENNDGFGCHVGTGYTGNKFLRCRAWNNADDGFDFLKAQSVVTADSCIAYANGKATYSDIKGNGNGIKAGGFGKGAFSVSMEIPMHVVKNSIAVKNRKSGFYSNHHLGGLQFENNRAYDNNPDFNMMNRAKESQAVEIPENSDPRMEVDGYDHLLSNNIVYRNSDFDKLVTYLDPEKSTLVGNSFTWQDGSWTNKAFTEADFVSLAISGLLKDRDATGKLPDAVFDFMKLKNASEMVTEPVVTVKSQTKEQVVYTVTWPADAELHYKLPGSDTEIVASGGSLANGVMTTDIEVTISGNLILWAQKGSSASSIVTISVMVTQPTGIITYDFVKMAAESSDLNIEETSKTTRYFSEKSATGEISDKSGNFYSISASPVSGAISWREQDVELTSNGLKPTKDARPFAIHGLQEGDVVRIEFTGDIYYAKHSKYGDALADMEAGNAITSMATYTISSIDEANGYIVFYPSKATVISKISINPVTASEPVVAEPTEENSDGSKTYTVTIGEGETLHYTAPDKEQEQTVTYAETDNGTYQITVTESGTLNCWTTKEGADAPSETTTIRVTLSKDNPTQTITIHTIGDSTMSSYDQSIPAQAGMDGWGDYLADCLKTEWVTVYNWADRGETAKSYYNGIWLKTSTDRPEFGEPVMNKIKTGDYVILQFGHNDSKAYSTSDYETWMGKLVDAVIEKGATPIIASSICRRRFENGTISLLGQINSIEDTKGRVPETAVTGDEHEYDYPYHAMLVAKAKDIEFIDVTAGTKALYEEYGEEKSAAFFPGSEKTHTNKLGAQTIAKVVARILYDDNTSLKKYVNTDALTLPDKESIEVVIESFGSDEVVTKKTIWTFNDYQDGDVIADEVICMNGLYIRGGSGNADGLFRILAKSSSPVTSVTFADEAKTKIDVEMSATTLNANDYADKIGSATAGRANANGFTRMFALNIGTSGTFYAKVGAETANKNIKLVFSGVTKEVVTTDGNVNDLTFKTETAGVIYICGNTPFSLYAAMFVPDMEKGTEEDWNYQMVQTRASGYWTYSNLSGSNQSVADGLTVYAVTAIDEEGKATLEDIGKVIPAGGGFLVKGAPNTEYALPSTTDEAAYKGINLMVANNELRFLPETENGKINYYFDGNKFVKATGSEAIHEKQAYLSVVSSLDEIEIEGVEEPESGVKNASVTLTDDSRKDRKVYTAVFEESQKLYYKRPGQDTEFRSANYKEEGVAITVLYNGDLEYYVTQTIDKVLCYSDTATIVVNTIAKKPTVTFQKVEDVASIYRIIWSKGTTLHYTIGDRAEQKVEDMDTVDVKVLKTAMLTVYSKNDAVSSDTISSRVYAPTPAIVKDGAYDFTLLKDSIGADYTLSSLGYDGEIEVGGVTLNRPNGLTSKTLDAFAFAAPRADGEGESTDWRLLNAGRLRAAKSSNIKHLSILNMKKGQYLMLNYSGAVMKYLSTGSAKLVEGTDTIVSRKAYEVVSDGDLLLSIPVDSLNNCDITYVSFTDHEVVSSPSFETVEGRINQVRLKPGASSFGKEVVTYYTTDGTTPTTKSTSIKNTTTLTIEESCTIKAYSVSETGASSSVAEFDVSLEESEQSTSAVYNLLEFVQKGDTISFSNESMAVYNKEYDNTDGWLTKRRTDFIVTSDFDQKVSVRNGVKGLSYDSKNKTVRLTRALAIHDLAVGDEIAIVYTGDGTLWSAAADEGDEFTVNGKAAPAGTPIPSGAIIKVTKTKFSNNYVVVTPSGEKAGKVYVSAIYINHDVPDVANVPTVELHDVVDTVAIYRFSFEEGSMLNYILEIEGTELQGNNSGSFDLEIGKSTKVEAWTTKGNAVSDKLETVLFAPTPAPSVEGDIDFTEASEDLPADLEVTLDSTKVVIVQGAKLYKPSALTAATFADRFAFSETDVLNKIRIRTNRQLTFAKGVDVSMGVLNLKRGDVVAFEYTGSIRIVNENMVQKESVAISRTRAGSGLLMVSGDAYIMKQDGDLLLTIELNDASTSISKMYIAAAPDRTQPTAIDFVTAAEEYEELELGRSTGVWYYGKTSKQQFCRFTNMTTSLDINGKISTEGGNGTLTNKGMVSGNRRIAIHNLAKGDSIIVRFSDGALTYEGHESKGDRIVVGDRQLAPQDTLQSGDVLVVSQVDYLNNYIVLKLDGKASISGIFINSAEIEKVSMPTIVDKGNNTVLISAGQSSIGNSVTTCYTTDGSEPSRTNGTSGPYDEFDVEMLSGGLITVKAVSYTDNGVYSKVAELTIFADDRIGRSGKSSTRSAIGTYDMQGNKVDAVRVGKLYIRDGKVVFFGIETK